MIDGLDRVLRDFIVESQENLERLDHEFIALEQNPEDKDLLADIFRTIHTIKGSAGFLSLAKLEQVSHHTEDVLAKLREQKLALDTDLTTTLLSSVDCIKSLLVTIEKTGDEGEAEIEAVVKKLQQITRGEKTFISNADLEQTSAIGPALKSEESALAGEDEEMILSKYETEDIEETATGKISEVLEHVVASTVEDNRIHVDVQLLDQLMNLTGELVLARNQVVQFANKLDDKNFRAISQRMNVVVSELQETVMKTRMQQIKKVFGIFPRLVRDLSKLHGKSANLVMEGQNTELDRTLIEAIKDPLTHLVRNALDHGVETPDIRKQYDKPPTATISIHAYHEGGLVNIEISDDGAGIDIARIKEKAIKEGILTIHKAEEVSERDLINLIFRPGFSTAAKITKISGRGVGMDVVKKNLDRIGGTIDVQTELHRGTTIKIRIPITLAIIPVLIVMAGRQKFAIPQVNLEELIMVQESGEKARSIEKVHGAEVYRLRGQLLPLIRLNQILQLSSEVSPTKANNLNIVVLSSGESHFGVIVDDVGDTEEIVVKALSSHIKQLSYYDGATIMGDGSLALILNASGLFSATQLTTEDLKKVEQAKKIEEQKKVGLASIAEQKQTIVLFRIGAKEYYGVPLAFVVRLEEFSASQIEFSGGREVIQYRNDILPLIRLEPFLNIASVPDQETLSLIVFAVEKQIGLVVAEIINTVEISTHIDTDTFKQKGILGSTIVEGHSVLILDIHGLIEMAYPNWYKKFFVSNLSEEERQNLTVLLAEDSMFFLNIEKSYLEAAGYKVITANNGNEALEKLENYPIDVVVTDLDMPYCTGFELTKKIKSSEQWRHLPVMALTALSGEQDRKKGIEAGIDEYQVKLDRDDVLSALERLILRSRT
ncbi:two-component system sensory/regulatory protein-like, Che family protein [Candidatus Vecturithrix granuli]|uniref:histidine kinase n=1 Tax=Vecturithrix granuli TaxID=1499967 RepID=A0A081C780_VECG1|nr:two-component system sensory/regulatory protein-like, Che family protein [Candidatus Vecturithrix granuli]